MIGRSSTSQASPQIYDYLRKYQEDPTSRVFAPLAEAYRKAGLVDEAIEIAREGLRQHPAFVGGKVALARALFDKKLFQEVTDTLAPVVQDVPDNLVAQRLIAESYLMLGHVAEALTAYKMLLYFSPADPETAQIVKELESQAYENGALVLRTNPQPQSTRKKAPEAQGLDSFDVRAAEGAIDSDPKLKKDRWVAQIETLQGLLQRVERYRVRTESQR